MRELIKPKNPIASRSPQFLTRVDLFGMRKKLSDLSEKAIGVLEDLLCSDNEKVRLLAASAILDKSLPKELRISTNPLEEMSDEQLQAIVEGGGEKPKRSRNSALPR